MRPALGAHRLTKSKFVAYSHLMAAQPQTDDLFAAPEIERACGMPARSLQFLNRAGHCPEPAEQGSRGRATLYDFDGLSVLAMIGALHSAALPLVPASKIARPIADRYRRTYGAVPWGAAELSRMVAENNQSGLLRWNGDRGIEPTSLHRAVLTIASYTPGRALNSDIRLAMVQEKTGRLFVYSVGDINVPNDYGIETKAQAELLVSGIKRGSEGSAVESFEDIFCFEQQNFPDRDKEALLIYERAVARLTVNVSLAIRNTLDAIADARASS